MVCLICPDKVCVALVISGSEGSCINPDWSNYFPCVLKLTFLHHLVTSASCELFKVVRMFHFVTVCSRLFFKQKEEEQ